MLEYDYGCEQKKVSKIASPIIRQNKSTTSITFKIYYNNSLTISLPYDYLVGHSTPTTFRKSLMHDFIIFKFSNVEN